MFPLLLAACAHERAPASDDLDGLVHYLYENYDDDRARREGMSALAEWMEGEGRVTADGLLLTPLTATEVAAVSRPERDTAVLIGVAFPWVSPHPLLEHGAITVEADQTWNSPSGYAAYTREVEDGDVSAYLLGEGRIRTTSEIDKKGAFGIHIPYLLDKDYAWVETDEGRALLARASVPEVGCAPSSANCLYQSFALDVFYSANADETLRLTAAYNELVTEVDALLTDEQRVGLMVSGLRDVMECTDDYLLER